MGLFQFRKKQAIRHFYHSFKFIIISTVVETVGTISDTNPTKDIATAAQYYYYHHLAYDLVVFGTFTLTFLLFWKLFKVYRTKAIPIHNSIKGHHWVSFQLPPLIVNNIVFCNVCKGIIVDGLYCDLCGICADSSSCHHTADSRITCKMKFLPESTASDGIHHHHWVEGNLPPHSTCFVCLEDITENDYLKDFRCCWCQRTVHEDNCLPSVKDEPCDFGKYARYIIPPESVRCFFRLIQGVRSNIILPTTPTNLFDECRPLTVIGNSKSGNNDGNALLQAFRFILNGIQVVDTATVPPERGLLWCKLLAKNHPDIAPWVLAAGGDGTVSWVLQSIDRLKLSPAPRVGIIPLGTGNDLAQVLGWGTSFNIESPIREIMDCLEKCRIVQLDRWSVRISPPILNLSFTSKSLVMNNYLSVGVDALVALDFHQTRESQFYNWFGSRLLNKILYFSYGTRDILLRKCSQLDKKIQLEMDGVIKELPQLESIVLLNIPSWGGGVDIWSIGRDDGDNNSDRGWPEQKIDDKLIEVVGIYSSLHIAQMMVGLAEPYRIGQAKTVKIKLFDQLPMQVDGEPWIQHPCTIKVNFFNQVDMLKVEN